MLPLPYNRQDNALITSYALNGFEYAIQLCYLNANRLCNALLRYYFYGLIGVNV